MTRRLMRYQDYQKQEPKKRALSLKTQKKVNRNPNPSIPALLIFEPMEMFAKEVFTVAPPSYTETDPGLDPKPLETSEGKR
jgi:hypothetical protein